MECPEPMEQGRNFRLLCKDEFTELLDFLSQYLPKSLKFHQTLLTYMQDRVWEFHFYVANNWPEDAICLHFPGMTLSPHGLLYESVGVFCPNDRLDLLRLLREEDILIDWAKPLYINFVDYDIAEKLSQLYEGAGTIERMVGDVCACEDSSKLEESEETEEGADPDVQVLPLKAEHAEGIHELYPANDMECHEIFLRLINTLPAAGVFVNGSLAAWMVQSYYGAMFSMQTKPEYRRRGYGTKLARYLTKRVAERGYRPFVVIRPENKASHSLYRKLGFVKLFETVRMIFTPYAWQESEDQSGGFLEGTDLESAVKQLTLEQRVIQALRNDEAAAAVDEELLEGEETLRDPLEYVDDATIIVEDGDENKQDEDADFPQEDELEPIMEDPVDEERVEIVESTEGNADDVPEEAELAVEVDDEESGLNEKNQEEKPEETSEAVDTALISFEEVADVVQETTLTETTNSNMEDTESQAGNCE